MQTNVYIYIYFFLHIIKHNNYGSSFLEIPVSGVLKIIQFTDGWHRIPPDHPPPDTPHVLWSPSDFGAA
jgi:hypothetical protein